MDKLLEQLPDSEQSDELRHRISTATTSVQYALRQLRQFRDIGRAIDALERVESALTGGN